MFYEPICVCDHTEDEHEGGFFRKCTVKGCDCLDFEPADSVLDDDRDNSDGGL